MNVLDGQLHVFVERPVNSITLRSVALHVSLDVSHVRKTICRNRKNYFLLCFIRLALSLLRPLNTVDVGRYRDFVPVVVGGCLALDDHSEHEHVHANQDGWVSDPGDCQLYCVLALHVGGNLISLTVFGVQFDSIG